MNNVVEVCTKHRERMYGKEATSKDFKDSFIINNCIENSFCLYTAHYATAF